MVVARAGSGGLVVGGHTLSVIRGVRYSDVMYNMVIIHCLVQLKFARRVELKCYYQKRKKGKNR